MRSIKFSRSGTLYLEILIAVTLLMLAVTIAAGAVGILLQSGTRANTRTQQSALMEEAFEATQAMSRGNWNDLYQPAGTNNKGPGYKYGIATQADPLNLIPAMYGPYNSLTIGTDGFPIISYYDGINGAVRVIKCGNINCIAGNADNEISTGVTQNNLDIAIGTETPGLPFILGRYNPSNGQQSLVKCGNAACSPGNPNTITSPSIGGSRMDSVAIPADNNPVISYVNSVDGKLKIYKCGNAACSSGSATAAIDDAGLSSIAISPSDGFPTIAYTGASGLKILKCGNAACSSGNGTVLVDTPSSYGSSRHDMVIGSDSKPVIAFTSYAGSIGTLKILKCGNAACSSGNSTTSVDSGYRLGNNQAGSITLDASNQPIVSYITWGTGGNDGELKLLRCGDTTCASGNNISTIESGIPQAEYSSATVAANRLFISYFNSNLPNRGLKFFTSPLSSFGTWQLVGGTPAYTQLITPGNTTYNRHVVIENVSRDASGNIVTSGGTDDPATQKVTVTVTGLRMPDLVQSRYYTHNNNTVCSQSQFDGSGTGQNVGPYACPPNDKTKYTEVSSTPDGTLGAWTSVTSPGTNCTTPGNGSSAIAATSFNTSTWAYVGCGVSLAGSSGYTWAKAPINADGTLGAWTSVTSPGTNCTTPGNGSSAIAATSFNTSTWAYVGCGVSLAGSSGYTWAKAPINADGTLGAWTSVTSPGTNCTTPGNGSSAIAATSFNTSTWAYVGCGVSLAGSSGYTWAKAPINADGTLGAWTSVTSPGTNCTTPGNGSSAIAATSFNTSTWAYVGCGVSLAGSSGYTWAKAPINADGTLGAWTSVTSPGTNCTTPGNGSSAIAATSFNTSTWAYVGCGVSLAGSSGYTWAKAPINADGTLGAWTSVTSPGTNCTTPGNGSSAIAATSFNTSTWAYVGCGVSLAGSSGYTWARAQFSTTADIEFCDLSCSPVCATANCDYIRLKASPTTGSLASTTFDAVNTVWMLGFNWSGVAGGAGSKVEIKIAMRNDTNFTDADFLGPGCLSADTDWYMSSNLASGQFDLVCGAQSGRYLRYRVRLTRGTSSPQFSLMKINYAK